MQPGWQIEYYKTRRGDEVVQKFIEDLPPITKTKVFGTLDLLMEYGINIGQPHSKKVVGSPLWELRILGKSSVRILYVAKIDRIFWLLHGFVKKSQKTPENDIKTALKRYRELA